jgi:hypothetical protein
MQNQSLKSEVSFSQDFMATHSDFFQGQMDRVLFYCPGHSGETQLSKQEKEEGA